MAVSDTGCGMTADVQAHMFEPFFTTKEAGKGTGLGLATVYGVVKQSGGSIEVYSEPGKGSAFKVYLPAVASAHDAVISSSLMPAVPAGNETVLLVEDEDGVRDLVREILRSHGYTVLLARHGVEALKVRQQHAGPVHLLLTDVIMPEMNGPDLAEQLGANDRKLAVLYMSGYTDHAVFNNRTIHSGAHFIQKPFTPGALARKVREVLGPAQPS
jgi:CheY-like chemotaxis protein